MTSSGGEYFTGYPPIPELTCEQDVAMRRRLAGRRDFRPDNGPPTRTKAGEWMWRTTLDLPEAMQLKLEALARVKGVPENQIVRQALVAFGIGDLSHVVGIADGSCSDDQVRREINAEIASHLRLVGEDGSDNG